MNTELADYLKTLPHGGQIKFANACGINGLYKAAMLQQYATGKRPIPPELAVRMEQESGGRMRREKLSPAVDWDLLASPPVRRPVEARP